MPVLDMLPPAVLLLISMVISYAGTTYALIASATMVSSTAVAACRGDDNCRVCTNCRYCRHCGWGGRCGVCRRPEPGDRVRTRKSSGLTKSGSSSAHPSKDKQPSSNPPVENHSRHDGILSELLLHQNWTTKTKEAKGIFVRMEDGYVTVLNNKGKLERFKESALPNQLQKVASRLEEKVSAFLSRQPKLDSSKRKWDNKSYRSFITYHDDRLWLQTSYSRAQKEFFLYLGNDDRFIEFYNPINRDHLRIDKASMMVNGKTGWVGIGSGEWAP